MGKINCALIMAGGKGTRFWPKSTETKPKQFLKLITNKTMIQETYERINQKIPSNQIFVVTGEKYKEIVMDQLPYITEKNIIVEPEGRNTAPCILLACLYIKQIFEEANIAVFPSDHIITNTEEFNNILNAAYSYVDAQKEAIVTIGIKPDRPETGYGYINFSNEKAHIANIDVTSVYKFVEKPNLETAKQYIDDGTYLWNAGMFIFNIQFMLNEFKEKFTEGYNNLIKLPSIYSKDYYSELKKSYNKCDSISIDYAIMEKSKNIYVIPSEFGWDDIGTWKSLQRYIKPDENSNIIKGNVKVYNSNENIVYSENKEIVLINVNNLFCIESDEIIVIGNKDEIGNVHSFREKI